MKFDFFDELQPRNLYCEIAAAVIGGAALSAGASIYGANKASDAQSAAAQASIQQANLTYGRNQATLQPFISGGTNALTNLTNFTDANNPNSPLAQLMKLTMPGADMSATLAQTPGYQFTQSQGIRGIQNALAGRGLGGSAGAITKNVGDYTAGLASNTWDSVVKNLLATFGSGTNALQGIVSTGANSGAALAGSGNASMNAINSALTGQGNAQAAAANATGSAVGGLGNSISTAAMLQQLTGGSGGGSVYGNPAFGGNGVWGGSSANPLEGLSPSDYGAGF